MNNEEVIKIDLSQKVLTPQQQKKEISHKVSLIKLEISSPADANAYYTIDKGDKPVQGQTMISKSGDSGCYVKTINAEEYRNSSLMVRCYAFNQIHTELTLKIAPPQLLVKSALFKKDGATVGDNCLDIVSDTNFVITVELTRPILDGENAKLHYKRYHKEPGGNVFKEYKTDTVDLKKNDRFKDITFYAPENHSGGTMAVSFYINQEVVPNENKSQNTVRYYKIVSKEGAKISSVYWSKNEAFTPICRNGEIVNYENSQVRNQICNNEDGFLHIHTRQMYGEKVKVSVFERDRIGDDAFIISRDVMILDNRACVVFSMQELLPMLYSSRNAWFEGDNFDLVALVEPANKWIPQKESTAPLYLKIEKRTYTPAKSTAEGTRKFVPGSLKEETKEETKGCGGKHCITKANYKAKNAGKLIQEINIRLAGFGGNVPTEDFTDRTEACIKQFQRDYMGVAATGKICGSLLKAIDDFEKKYVIKFDDVKCTCQKCDGFGSGKYHEEYNIDKFPERERRYEYPGIHRSLIWALKGVMFYTENTEKAMGFSVNCISSGYRCWNDNYLHKRSSTNHMGKALDIHFNKNKKRTQKNDDIEQIRERIFNKYLGARWDWKQKDIFNMESTKMGATTWVHFDVREYSLKYLDKCFFASNIEQVNGESLIKIAQKYNLADMCNCINSIEIDHVPRQISRKNIDFTEKDAEDALRYIFDTYGKEIATIVERMYRLETSHFKSSQYMKCGTGGMEVHGNAPYYGWDKSFFDSHPNYKPVGVYDAYEGKGLSGQGGNTQVTDRKKQFVILPSVEAGMVYKAEYIIRYDRNYARWYSTNAKAQQEYKKTVAGIRARIVEKF